MGRYVYSWLNGPSPHQSSGPGTQPDKCLGSFQLLLGRLQSLKCSLLKILENSSSKSGFGFYKQKAVRVQSKHHIKLLNLSGTVFYQKVRPRLL